MKAYCLNNISKVALNTLKGADGTVDTIEAADSILVRSQEMKDMDLPANILAVARAGAGVNNIPLDKYAEAGVVVFNTPGANANAVKELVLAALLLASRDLIGGAEWVKANASDENIGKTAEKAKKNFAGTEILGKTIAVIGLGAIGAMVANLALHFGMDVWGYDPFLSVNAALKLDKKVKIAETLDSLYAKCDYITIHVPQTNDTKGMINAASIKNMKDGVRIINIARGGLVNNADIIAALDSGKVSALITDFAAEELLNHPKVVCMPHLGASTPEAEDNCAIMASAQLKDFLEHGNIVNSVNFPKTVTDNPIPAGGTRLCISHKNIPDTISKFTTILGEAKLNISAFINQARGDVAYNIIDVDGVVTDDIIAKLAACDTVNRVRPIFG